jgi:hypothetical protein
VPGDESSSERVIEYIGVGPSPVSVVQLERTLFGETTVTSAKAGTLAKPRGVDPSFREEIRLEFVSGDPYTLTKLDAVYNINAIPEPSTYALLLTGFGLLALVNRYRLQSTRR